MPVVIDPDPATVAGLLDAMPDGAHGIDSTERLTAWLGEHTDEYLVVLGPHLDLDAALATCESLRTGRPTISVVLARDLIDAGLLTRAIKAGARDVVAVTERPHLAQATVRPQRRAFHPGVAQVEYPLRHEALTLTSPACTRRTACPIRTRSAPSSPMPSAIPCSSPCAPCTVTARPASTSSAA